MAHSSQAKKRMRQSEKRAARNRPHRTRAARRVRDAREAIEDGDAAAAGYVRDAQSALDQAARRGIVHSNAAARRKRRLAGQLKALPDLRIVGSPASGDPARTVLRRAR